MSEELRRWNMEAVISTVDIKESPMGLYVKYIDIEPLLSECKKVIIESREKVQQWLNEIYDSGGVEYIGLGLCLDNIDRILAKLEQAGVK